MTSPIKAIDLKSELTFSASRSSGPGGQNVNKVNSKITLKWDVAKSQLIREEHKQLLLKKLSSRLTAEGVLLLVAQENRSQLQNRDEAISKLDLLLELAFKQKKIRKPSKPSLAIKKRRVEGKRKHAEKKEWRRKI